MLEAFSGLPGRLEFLGEKNGIAFYDDANSTTPEAMSAALGALAQHSRPVILIAGGTDKELDFIKLAPEIDSMAKKVILFKGSATDKLMPLLLEKIQSEIVIANSMEEAFNAAIVAASAHDIILLSPGATSFGIFKNEYDRGDQFRACFEKLK